MLGKGVSRESFQPRTCSGKKVSKTGQAKEDLENIVYIDLDSDQFDDVEIIDCPEVVTQKLNGSSGPSRGRTSPQSVISIDDDESDDVDHVEIDDEGVGDWESDDSSNKRFFTAFNSVRNSEHVDVDDCDVHTKDSVSKSQKGKQASVSNLQKSKEVSSSKSARNRYGLYGSEIESSDSDCSDCEVIKREQWEKVSAKRKRRVFNDQSHHNEHASSSGLHGNNHNNTEVENRSGKHGKDPLYGPSRSKYVKENQSSFNVDDIRHGERTTREKVYPCLKKNCNFCYGVPGSSRFNNELGDEESKFKDDIRHGERTPREKFSACPVSACPNTENSNFCTVVTGFSRFKEKLGAEDSKFKGSNQDSHDRQVDKDESPLNAHDRKINNDESPLRSKDNNIYEENMNGASCDERHVNGHEFESHTQDGDLTASNEKNIITERERHKETDLYKKAMEEELASRQQQLKIQAEEAQRLRKRKKAESSLERKQKGRVEEVRETTKKVEELMNMKEQLRKEIKTELKKLETQCTDMPSLLRGLGINVGANLIPLPNEVKAAYKQAMFKFHPDKVSKTDIRGQIEAEEKCKLITLMKKKFPFA